MGIAMHDSVSSQHYASSTTSSGPYGHSVGLDLARPNPVLLQILPRKGHLRLSHMRSQSIFASRGVQRLDANSLLDCLRSLPACPESTLQILSQSASSSASIRVGSVRFVFWQLLHVRQWPRPFPISAEGDYMPDAPSRHERPVFGGPFSSNADSLRAGFVLCHSAATHHGPVRAHHAHHRASLDRRCATIPNVWAVTSPLVRIIAAHRRRLYRISLADTSSPSARALERVFERGSDAEERVRCVNGIPGDLLAERQ